MQRGRGHRLGWGASIKNYLSVSDGRQAIQTCLTPEPIKRQCSVLTHVHHKVQGGGSVQSPLLFLLPSALHSYTCRNIFVCLCCLSPFCLHSPPSLFLSVFHSISPCLPLSRFLFRYTVSAIPPHVRLSLILVHLSLTFFPLSLSLSLSLFLSLSLSLCLAHSIWLPPSPSLYRFAVALIQGTRLAHRKLWCSRRSVWGSMDKKSQNTPLSNQWLFYIYLRWSCWVL